MLTGYLSPGYAESLVEFGRPRELTLCGGWILERLIPGFDCYDAMGCYPIFTCQDWSKLGADLENIKTELVSLEIVSDPFGKYDETTLRQAFDSIIPYKQHFVADITQDPDHYVSKWHKKTMKKAIGLLDVEFCPEPLAYIDQWSELYAILIKRHNITGIPAFSRKSFEKQLAVPGLIMVKAEYNGEIVGINLLYLQGEVAYGHLVACNALGYEFGAAYAMKWYLLHYLSGKVKWLDLGGGAGLHNNGVDGLSLFKRGWSTGTRTAYFCTKIFDPERYNEIANAKGLSSSDYFPSYRKGEFH